MDIDHNAIFALRLNAFEDFAAVRDVSDTNITATTTDTVTGTLGHTVDTAASRNWFFLGFCNNDVGNNNKQTARRIEDSSLGVIDGNTTADVWQNGSTDSVPILLANELASIADTTVLDIDFIVQEAADVTPQPVIIETIIAGFTWELAAGGTEFTQTVAGTMTPTGAQTRETQKAIAGLVTPTGAQTRETQTTVAGSVTPTGAILRDIFKIVAGSLTPTGIAAGVRLFFQTLAGAMTPTGAQTRETQTSVAGVMAPTGAQTRETQTTVAGAITPTGAIIRDTLKVLTGVITPTGIVSTIKLFVQAVAGAITPVGTQTRETQKAVAGAFTPTGAQARETQTTVEGSVTPTGSMNATSVFFRTLTGALAPVGALATAFIGGMIGAVDGLFRIILRRR